MWQVHMTQNVPKAARRSHPASPSCSKAVTSEEVLLERRLYIAVLAGVPLAKQLH